MQRIVPNIWLDDQAEEAAHFYTTVFGGKINRIDQYTDAGKAQHGHDAGDVMAVDVIIDNTHFTLLNGGPLFTPNPSISFTLYRETSGEVEALWNALIEDGTALMPLDEYPFNEKYGWVQDKFGVSWQLLVNAELARTAAVPSFLFTKHNAGNAEDAIKLYTSLFPDSRVEQLVRYPADMKPEVEGNVMHSEFFLFNERFVAMESSQQHEFIFSEAISLMVLCDDQAQIDELWHQLSAVPEAEQCGWLKDHYGVSWQIVPRRLDEMMENGTPEQMERVTAAFMQMKKFDIAALEKAYGSTTK